MDQSLRETATVFVMVLVLTIVVDSVTADKELSLEIALIRLIPGIITVGLIIKEALSLNTIVAWATWITVTIIMYPVTNDIIEPIVTALIAIAILVIKYKMDN